MEDINLITPDAQPKKRKSEILIAVVITAVISVFVTLAVVVFFVFGSNRFLKLRELEFYVNNYFYGESDPDAVTDGAMAGYISALGDRFSHYFNSEDTDKRGDELQGNGKGVGIIVTRHPDTGNIYVDKVYDNCPAQKAGVREGDQITAVDGKLVTEVGYSQSVDDIIREIGSTVTFTLLRGNQTLQLEVTYDEFPAQSVFYEMIEGDIGYIDITTFNAETVPQFKNAVNALITDGATALIFDLRGNGGGTVDSVTEMVDFLVPEGIIMTAKYAGGKEKTIATSDAEEVDLPMAVLTDSATASASELFCASIKDFGKGVSVGSTTFGKGVMQSTYYMSDGSSAVLTVAEFFPHSGKSFNGKGIAPDIEITLSEEQLKYFYQLNTDEDTVIQAAVKYFRNEK